MVLSRLYSRLRLTVLQPTPILASTLDDYDLSQVPPRSSRFPALTLITFIALERTISRREEKCDGNAGRG